MLSDSYQNVSTTLLWKCQHGHEWTAPLGQVKDKGTWCPTCARIPRTSGLEVAQQVALSHKGKCLSKEYVNSCAALIWECARGHAWEAPLMRVQGYGSQLRSWCPTCAIERRRLPFEAGQSLAALQGGELLSSEYKNRKSPLLWRCGSGHTWQSTVQNVKSRKLWCPHCPQDTRCGKREEVVRRVLDP